MPNNRNPRKPNSLKHSNKVPHAAELLAMAAGRWHEILIDAGIPAEYLDRAQGPCPKCGGSDRFSPMKDHRERGAVHCRGCFNKNAEPRPGDGLASLRWCLGCDEFEAKKWLNNWLLGHGGESVSPPPVPKPNKPTESKSNNSWDTPHARARAGLTQEMAEKVAEDLGVSVDALLSLRAGYGQFKWEGSEPEGTLVFPMMLSDSTTCGLTFRNHTTRKKRRAKGSDEGLTFDPELLQRKVVRLFVTEGQTDGTAAETLGLDAVAIPAAGQGLDLLRDLVTRLAPGEVVIVADNDEPGRKSAEAICRALRSVVAVRVVYPPQGVKDLRAWLAAGADRAAVEAVADAAELLPIEQAADAGSLSPGADWREPQKIGRGELPAFPVEVLPEPLRSFVAEVGEATQTPADLCGLLALAFCSGAVMRYVEIEAGRGWREPVNLYVAVLLDPANRKSAVFAECLRPIKKIERERIEVARPEVARLASIRRQREKLMHVCEKKAAEKGDAGAAREAEEIAAELETEPVTSLPKLICDDSTAEAAEKILAEQGGRLIVAGAEGGLFDVMAGRYTNGASAFDVFLKCHAGDDLRIDRVGGRKCISVDRPAMAMAYAVQPQVIEGLAENPVFRGRGLPARFCYAIPKSLLGRRKIDPEPMSDRTRQAYENLIRRLYEICKEPQVDEGPFIMRLAPDANAEFMAFRRDVEQRLGDGAELELLRDWGGKLCGLAARLAAIIHLVATDRSEPWRDPVGVESIRAAIAIADYLVPHAAAVIDLMAAESDEATEDAAYLSLWIAERGLAEFRQQDAYQHGRARFTKDAKRLTAALSLLVKHGWIRPKSEPEKDGKGRKSSPLYEVNPAAFQSDREPQGDKDSDDWRNIRGVI